MVRKSARILSIIALCFIGVFTVTFVINLFGVGGVPILVAMFSSAGVAVILFAIVKLALRDKKPKAVIMENNTENNVENDSNIAENAEENKAKASTTKKSPSQKNVNENGVEYLD